MALLPMLVMALVAMGPAAGVADPALSADLAADDECADGVCALSELQLRARASESADEEAGSGSRRRVRVHWANTEIGVPAQAAEPPGSGRRRRLVMWKPTPIVDGDQQPETCANHTIRKGYEGCCAGQLYQFENMGCCGSLLYRTDELACCRHRNGTATIYNSLTSNCCDDPLKKNKEDGIICHLSATQSSCCHIQTVGRRRRRSHGRRRHHE
mmetsp:Transcript_21838/g.62765  ORF Transcript_21838/g.62765 Transcript_21838/m.62765 type:complete len:214 (-) Transcript_21838:156-797(-)